MLLFTCELYYAAVAAVAKDGDNTERRAAGKDVRRVVLLTLKPR